VADTRTLSRTVALAAAADLVAVLAFATIGRRSHAEGLTVLGVLDTAAPFLLGLLAGWLAGRVWRAPTGLRLGVAAWAGTVIIGLAVRAAFTHRLPASFVLVAMLSLAVFLLGWRALALVVTHLTRSRRRSA
jgi:hypothetical protein